MVDIDTLEGLVATSCEPNVTLFWLRAYLSPVPDVNRLASVLVNILPALTTIGAPPDDFYALEWEEVEERYDLIQEELLESIDSK